MITPALRITKDPREKIRRSHGEGEPSEARTRAHSEGRRRRSVPV